MRTDECGLKNVVKNKVDSKNGLVYHEAHTSLLVVTLIVIAIHTVCKDLAVRAYEHLVELLMAFDSTKP